MGFYWSHSQEEPSTADYKLSSTCNASVSGSPGDPCTRVLTEPPTREQVSLLPVQTPWVTRPLPNAGASLRDRPPETTNGIDRKPSHNGGGSQRILPGRDLIECEQRIS